MKISLKTFRTCDNISAMPYLTGGNFALEEGGENMFDVLMALGVQVVGTVIGELIVDYIRKKFF